MTIDISELSLGDSVKHPKYGIGYVVACTEKPNIKVSFPGTVKVTFTQRQAVKQKLEAI